MINEYYPDYDFLPFLKSVLVTNSVGPNDQIIFYDFIKKYISLNNYTDKISDESKEKFRKEILELISENDKEEITLEQLKLFIAIFIDINKDKINIEENNNKEYEVKDVNNIEELKGMDKLWGIITNIKNEKVLSLGINIIYQIYKNNNLEKLLEKCNSFIGDNKLLEKYTILMRQIIIESEKNILFTPKSHTSLLKQCFINLPFEIKKKMAKAKENTEKFLSFGNSNAIDMKIIISKIYEESPYQVEFSLSKNFLKFLEKNKEKEIKDNLILDESYNNKSLYELIIQNDKGSNLLPKEKILFSIKKLEEEKLLINGEMNPKLIKIFKEWFKEFTEGTMKMDAEATVKFISEVTPNKSRVFTTEKRVTDFLKEDLENRGYVNEEEFINFFYKAIKDPRKCPTVWSNLEQMGIGKDLKKVKENNEEYIFYESDKLPRYKLGNDLYFIENLVKKYYENPEDNDNLYEFLFYLTTNEKVYNEV